MFEFLVNLQRMIRSTLSDHIEAFAATGAWSALLAMVPLGIVFGAVHAMTPGHSKSVLASYVLGSGVISARAAATSLLLSVTHISSAVVLALVTNSLVTRTVVGAGRAPVLEYTSRYLLVAIGAWMIVRALRNRQHAHGEGIAFGFFAGLVPCPLTLFVMTLAVSRGVPLAGAAFALTMLAGVAAVLLAIASGIAWGRQHAVRWMEAHGARIHGLGRAMEGAAGALLVTLALAELG